MEGGMQTVTAESSCRLSLTADFLAITANKPRQTDTNLHTWTQTLRYACKQTTAVEQSCVCCAPLMSQLYDLSGAVNQRLIWKHTNAHKTLGKQLSEAAGVVKSTIWILTASHSTNEYKTQRANPSFPIAGWTRSGAFTAKWRLTTCDCLESTFDVFLCRLSAWN